ncbi:hypothetical protein [Calidithermus terrae]|nr:hypothetical protein [Calidithermus terrae]
MLPTSVTLPTGVLPPVLQALNTLDLRAPTVEGKPGSGLTPPGGGVAPPIPIGGVPAPIDTVTPPVAIDLERKSQVRPYADTYRMDEGGAESNLKRNTFRHLIEVGSALGLKPETIQDARFALAILPDPIIAKIPCNIAALAAWAGVDPSTIRDYSTTFNSYGNQWFPYKVGNTFHDALEESYRDTHPTEAVYANDTPLSTIIARSGGDVSTLDPGLLRSKPDIYSSSSNYLYEMKSQFSLSKAIAESQYYIDALNDAGVPAVRRPVDERGTQGLVSFTDTNTGKSYIGAYRSVYPGTVIYCYCQPQPKSGREPVTLNLPMPTPVPAKEVPEHRDPFKDFPIVPPYVPGPSPVPGRTKGEHDNLDEVITATLEDDDGTVIEFTE